MEEIKGFPKEEQLSKYITIKTGELTSGSQALVMIVDGKWVEFTEEEAIDKFYKTWKKQ